MPNQHSNESMFFISRYQWFNHVLFYEWNEHFFIRLIFIPKPFEGWMMSFAVTVRFHIFFLWDQLLRKRADERETCAAGLNFSLSLCSILLFRTPWLASLFDFAVDRKQMSFHSAEEDEEKLEKKKGIYLYRWWVTCYRQDKADGRRVEEKTLKKQQKFPFSSYTRYRRK